MPEPLEGCLSIGQVLRPQGLRGQVKIRPDTDDPGRFSALARVFVKDRAGRYEALTVNGVSVRSGFVYLHLGGDSTVEAAELRRGLVLYIPRGEAVPLGEHENFISDLIGCQMVDTEGRLIGTVEDVLQPGANDVYVVKTDQGTLLVPALKHVVLAVDVENKVVTAHAQRLWEVSLVQD